MKTHVADELNAIRRLLQARCDLCISAKDWAANADILCAYTRLLEAVVKQPTKGK